MKPSDVTPDDTSRNGVQAGCGALFGLVVPFSGAFFGVSILGSGVLAIVLACLGSALLFGFLAYQFGDRFWGSLRRWWF